MQTDNLKKIFYIGFDEGIMILTCFMYKIFKRQKNAQTADVLLISGEGKGREGGPPCTYSAVWGVCYVSLERYCAVYINEVNCYPGFVFTVSYLNVDIYWKVRIYF